MADFVSVTAAPGIRGPQGTPPATTLRLPPKMAAAIERAKSHRHQMVDRRNRRTAGYPDGELTQNLDLTRIELEQLGDSAGRTAPDATAHACITALAEALAALATAYATRLKADNSERSPS
jgi:hypothetical protein